jgi:molybdate transport system substrate-binding protein
MPRSSKAFARRCARSSLERGRVRRLLASIVALILLLLAPHARAQGVTVFAAASLTDALHDIAAAWVREGHAAPRLSFAASSTLARQIEQGAPAGIFASADEQWMDYLARSNLIVPGTRNDLLGNQLVLIVPSDHATTVAIRPGFDLVRLLGANGRLALGDPANVPAGIYARQALTRLGVWNAVEPRLARAEDVRAALLLVERGEAAAGIVYATDARAARGVSVAGTFPPDSHDPIRYPIAIVRAGDTAAARALLAFIEGPKAQSLFAKYGFSTD